MEKQFLMDLVHHAQSVARKAGREHGRVCILINHDAFNKIQHEMRGEMIFIDSPDGNRHVMYFFGARISWSPLHDKTPGGYTIGEYWGGPQ